MIKLQPRDIGVLQKLSRFGVLSSTQIAKRFFLGIARTTVLRRIKSLFKTGLIVKCGHLRTGEKVWSLSKPGANAIGVNELFRFSNQNTLSHDVALSEARFVFENIGLGEDWTSEAEMKRNINPFASGPAVVPDGLFLATVFSEPQVVALELEMSPKSHKRYRRLLIDYSHKSAIGIIWYLVKSDSISVPILKQWAEFQKNKRFRHTQRILFTLYDDFIANKANAQIRDGNSNRFALHEVFSIENPAEGVSRPKAAEPSINKDPKTKSDQPLPSSIREVEKAPSALDSSPSTYMGRSRGLQAL